VYNGIVFRVTDAAAALLSHKSILDLVEEPSVVPGMVKFGRDRCSFHGAWRPLLSAARDGDALPLPSIFS